jgi:hypothetical protein
VFFVLTVSTSVVSLLWASSSTARRYLLYRNDSTLLYSGIDTYYEDDSVQAGNSYAYRIQIQNQDSSLTLASEPVVYETTTTASGEFQCGGTSGVVRLDGYSDIQQRTWTIWPSSQSGLLLNVRSVDRDVDRALHLTLVSHSTG